MSAPEYLTINELPVGTTGLYEFSFAGGYLEKSHVRLDFVTEVGARVNYPLTEGMFVTEFTVQIPFADIPAGTASIRIYRETPRDAPLLNFSTGSRLTERNLDRLAQQTIFVAAEAFDAGAFAVAEDLIGQALTAIEQTQALIDQAQGIVDTAADSASVANSAQLAASGSATAAAGSATSASSSATTSLTQAGLAIAARDAAALSASAAAGSASSAAGSATAASGSASAAAVSAQQAAVAANATAWVSGLAYSIGANVWDPVDFLTYRRKFAGASSVRPGLDSTNWVLISGQGNVVLNGGQLAGFRNLIINGNFNINQRGYVSGAPVGAANTYTLDRWRVVTSGQSLANATVSGNGLRVSAPAGGVEQVIEAANIGGGTYVLSWTGTATATVNGTARTKGEAFTLTANTAATVRLIGGTVSLVQLEPGTVVTPFEHRPIGVELAMCQRYFVALDNASSLPVTPNINVGRGHLTFPQTMRAVPSCVFTYDLGFGATWSIGLNGGYQNGDHNQASGFSVRASAEL